MADGDDNAYNAGNNDDVRPDDDPDPDDDDDDDDVVDDNDESPTSNSLNLSQFVFDDIE